MVYENLENTLFMEAGLVKPNSLTIPAERNARYTAAVNLVERGMLKLKMISFSEEDLHFQLTAHGKDKFESVMDGMVDTAIYNILHPEEKQHG